MDILIRHRESSDIPAIKAFMEQLANYSATLQLPYPSLDRWHKRLSETPDNVYCLVAVVEEKVVAHMHLAIADNIRRKHVAHLGMAVNESYQGKGVGSKLLSAAIDLAENWLALKRLELTVYTDNKAAIALYEKYDFVKEGIAKAFAFRNGEYVDVHYMARIKT
ncbi:GNAT family N-acetyltransferase [Spartinivicinus poritis]|uniref:GNAT family N-acetyltransferase n=1 Tax=Spartinivicinus poritis TaxID=2994640 RepID=A0ABT5UFI0_9GAMM|nr:GNAT family N-acetyltransferase [Spartinivicinus sp. A2-2]MDE1465140.1 GNAT family N-acetyltransferase [Spartinivicinus sp. A2-2]